MTSVIGYVSDEYYATLPDTAIELHGPDGRATLTRSWPSGAVYAEVPPGLYDICLSKPGYGSKRVRESDGALVRRALFEDHIQRAAAMGFDIERG